MRQVAVEVAYKYDMVWNPLSLEFDTTLLEVDKSYVGFTDEEKSKLKSTQGVECFCWTFEPYI